MAADSITIVGLLNNCSSSGGGSSGGDWFDFDHLQVDDDDDKYQILVNKNGTAMNPIDLNIVTLITHIVCCFVGLVLNLIMACEILRKRRLNSKPRNIFQLNLVLCNIFTLFTATVEIVYYFWPDDQVCLVFTAIVGVSYVAFFLNLLLSLIDRYLAISRPLWHRGKVTVSWVIFCQLFLTILFALIMKWIYVGGVAQVRCEIPVVAMVTFQVTILVLFISCVIVRIVVYSKTKRYIPRRSVSSSSSSRVSSSKSARINNRQQQQQHVELIEMNRAAAADGLTVHLNDDSVAQLDLEATRAFIANVTVLLLLPCPLLIFSFSYLICIPIYGTEQCSDSIIWLLPYFKELILFHAAVHPAMILWRNKEFTLSTPTPADDSKSNRADVLFG